MSGDAISSKGVAMYLSKGAALPYIAEPTAISKAAPTVVTAPAPTPPQLPFTPLTIVGGATTSFTVSASDFEKITDQGATPDVTFAGFTGAWVSLNATHVSTPGAPGSNTFTVPIDSSAFGAVPSLAAVTATVEADAITLAVGQIVRVNNSGFTALDGKLFTIGAVGAGTFSLMGADTTGAPGSMSDDAEVEIYESTDLVRMCLTSFTFNPETPGTVAVGTYCNPSATLPAVATSAGTATLGGWIDKDDLGYKELVLAAKDTVQRIFSIVLPQSQGEIIAPITFSQVAWDIPLDGGMAFTANGALGSSPVHLF